MNAKEGRSSNLQNTAHNSRRTSRLRPVSQEHSMGCGVACVASLCGTSYQEALKLFTHSELAWTRGYYCEEIVEALSRHHLDYTYSLFNSMNQESILDKVGTIVFCERSERYPDGHYFVRAELGWMNPWSNFPLMVPVKSAFQLEIIENISHIIFERMENRF